MAKTESLKQLGDHICQDYLGFLPTSNSVKPPHIANGLFRECTGEVCYTKDIHEWVVSERRTPSATSLEIIERYKEILWKGNKENPENIKQLRYLMDEIFNQDNTVYPEYGFSVFNISSHWLLKGSVKSEQKIGRFLFEILAKRINGYRSPAIDLIHTVLSHDNDDLTRILKPIIAFPVGFEKRTLHEIEYPPDEDVRWDSCKEAIRSGFDNLAQNIIATKENKNSLLVLQRIVTFAGFAAFLYLVDCNRAIHGGSRVPILLDAGTGMESIKKASEQCFIAGKKAVEDYFSATLFDILNQEMPAGDTNDCMNWIESMRWESAERESSIKSAVISYFESFCADGESPLKALAHAAQIALYTFVYKNNSPSDFCRVLGVRCGLIGPKGNRANIKRFLINSFTLETIVLSILSEENLCGIEMKELGQKATTAYNILVGTNADAEYGALEEANITQSTPGDLRGDLTVNAQAIADTFISLGLAKRYADGVTLIGWRL